MRSATWIAQQKEAYERGELTPEEMREFFRVLIRTGLDIQFGGHYARMSLALKEKGLLTDG